MSLDKWRSKMAATLLNALRVACDRYNGTIRDHIQLLLTAGDVVQAYFVLTQTSQRVANETKALFFLDTTKLVGVLGKPGQCDDMEGMEVTQRTAAWRKAIAALVPWWTEPNNLVEQVWSRHAPTTAQQDGKVNCISQYSCRPLEIGTYIHEAFGESIAVQCAAMFGWINLTCIVPGRMIHAGLPWIGVTPDAICVVDERQFHTVSRRLMAGDVPPPLERGAGLPWMTLEIKTIHGRISEAAEEDATVRVEDIDQLYSVYENDHDFGKDATKEAALKLLVKKLELAGWIPKNLYEEDNDYKLEKSIVKFKKTVNSSKRKACAFFKKSTILYPTKQFQKLRVTDVGGEVYPNLALLPSDMHRIAEEPPKKKRTYQNVVPLQSMVAPGKACVIVYRIGETVLNEMLFRLDWEEAPFMLTLNSNHFNQTMAQHATARQLNEDVKSVFAVTLKSHQTLSGRDPVQLAIVYAYDVGITGEAVDAFSNVLSREIALAAQGVEESASLHAMLLQDTSLEDRRKILYRRASAMEKLADPSDPKVLNEYRQTFFTETADESDEWSMVDVLTD